MSKPDDPQRGWAEGGPERLYVVTVGRRSQAEQIPFDLVTLVVAKNSPKPGMSPEHGAILRLCTKPLSVAELSAYLSLPASTVTVLVADLVESGQVEIRTNQSAKTAPDRALLEEVIDGLRKL